MIHKLLCSHSQGLLLLIYRHTNVCVFAHVCRRLDGWRLHRRQAATDAALLRTAQRLGSETGKRDHTRSEDRRGGGFFTLGTKVRCKPFHPRVKRVKG